jgi:hypothetical protein
MRTFRITTMVTQDVVADDENQAVSQALESVKVKVGDFSWAAINGSRSMWVTGIAQDSSGYMVYEMTPMATQVFTNE